MIKPIFTEKSLADAKKGKYSFWVDRTSDKSSLKAAIAKVFSVEVVSVRTSSGGGETGRSARGRKFTHLRRKKAIVTLKKGQKLDIFEPAKKK